MTQEETVKIELDPATARILKIWYEAMKKPLLFRSIDEFLITGCRLYMSPFFKLITPEMKQELADMYKGEDQHD